MKKTFTLFFFLGILSSLSVFAQAPRTILIEEFTSATCPPCAATNPIFKKFVEQFGGKVINMAFQCNIPTTGDPMYAANTSDVNTRMTYYGINSAPNCRMDGKVAGIDPNGAASTHPLYLGANTVNNRLAVTSPIEIKVTHNVILGTGGAKDSMEINVDIKNVSSSDFSNANYVLQTAIIEELIRFPKQAATNGETEFHVVMRKMLPSAAGTKITDVIAPGATKTVTFKAAVPTYIYSYKELAVVAYLQNNTASSKEIIQTGISEPKTINGLYYDVAADGKIINRVDNCDNTVGYEINVTNLSTGTDTIKTIDFIPVVGGSNKTKSTWTGVLLPGGSITHKLGNQTMPVGIAGFNVYVDKINGGAIKDLNVVNNFGQESKLTTFNNAVSGPEIHQGFETPIATTAPPNTFFLNEGVRIFKQDSTFARLNGQDPPYGMGGYGKSRYMVFYAFSDGGVAGASSSVIFDKIDLSASKATKMVWDYAYAVRDAGSFDKMEVLVSTDCGSTWTSVYEKQGEDMKSCDPDLSQSFIPGFFLPQTYEWKTEELDLRAYDGTPELMIRMKGTAGNGWAYFLDNVNVSSGTATNNPGILKSLSIAPNPTTEVINIRVQAEESSQATVSLTDLNGRTVSSYNRAINAGYNQITIPAAAQAGVYVVEVKTAKGVRTEKVTVF
ncbi:MAG: T9SS type A sorting domain-containing protein [Saprospiraceae bacterium]|nr:T9SS type A sorting domain-containing protein [Saprospiraceae bacterium]HMW38432.1 T9SS type A sorting domain-containing protein [Saprospiraceae bacterium]HMX87598.1 T9SS type A sorting domain-containing protein [Saprospiraceae bacterium]HMZ40895.1 T9SS type A sorting domain-containing protein [Saprospiraceae bacterium]HNA65822.1 T9SS type A sorting domain-containing protein [Saprospiraceae bacterium]